MRSREEVEQVQEMVEAGANDCEISRRTGIPRSTIRDWRYGKVPRRPPERSLGGCPKCGRITHDFLGLPAKPYAYLLGMYLGDGCISRGSKGVYSLRIYLDRKYPTIVRECQIAMTEVMPTNKVSVYSHPHQNVEQVTSSSRAWPCLFPQTGAGKKHERRIALVDWQRKLVFPEAKFLLRGLVHSDGSRSLNTIRHPKRTYVYPRYEFSNYSDDIRQIFCDACDLLKIQWRQMNSTSISVARSSSVAAMDRFIGPKF